MTAWHNTAFNLYCYLLTRMFLFLLTVVSIASSYIPSGFNVCGTISNLPEEMYQYT
jgi:hypothetical protein